MLVVRGGAALVADQQLPGVQVEVARGVGRSALRSGVALGSDPGRLEGVEAAVVTRILCPHCGEEIEGEDSVGGAGVGAQAAMEAATTFAPIVEAAAGHRAQALEAGFGPHAAEHMGVTFHQSVFSIIVANAHSGA